jgi:hypothetical protein
MKRKIVFVIAAMIMIVAITGCPYESPVPLSDSCTSTIDPGLIGRWLSPSTGGNNDTLDFIKFNDHEYYIESQSKGISGIKKTSRGRGFVTYVNNQKFINFCDLDDPGKFVFFKYEIRDKMMITWSPSDKFTTQPFSSSSELVDFFKKNMDKIGFFEPADTAFRE